MIGHQARRGDALASPRPHLNHVPFRRRLWREVWPPLVLALPAAVVVTFIVIPAIGVLIHSFYAADALGRIQQFIGFGNYAALFGSSTAQLVLLNTLIYSVAAIALSMLVALGLSLLLHARRLNLATTFSLFSPTVIPMVAAANLWLYFTIPGYGVVDRLLKGIGLGQMNWLGYPGTAVLTMVLLFVWKFAPYYAFFLIAGLQAIPSHIRDAARLEDKRGFATFRQVILPLLKPMMLFTLTLSIINAVETVDPVYVMTQGGPNNATNFLLYYLYNLGFNYFNWGQANALSVVVAVVLGAFSIMYLYLLERRSFLWQ